VLREFGENLWIAEGPVVPFVGMFPYPTRMAVVRLSDGGLWIWSPFELDDALAKEVEALGPVRHLVSPNKLHHLWLGDWKQRYPDAQMLASPGLARRRRDLAFDAELSDEPDPAWAADVDQVIFRGSFYRASRTALVCDLVQRMDPSSLTGLAGWILKIWGLSGERGSTPLEWRWSWWNRRAGRAAKETLLAWKPERLVIAHGMCAEQNATLALEAGLHWL
jgi:hypothetical protein